MMNRDDLVEIGRSAIRTALAEHAAVKYEPAPDPIDAASTEVVLGAVAAMLIAAIRDYDTAVAQQFVANLRRALEAPSARQATIRRWPGIPSSPPARPASEWPREPPETSFTELEDDED